MATVQIALDTRAQKKDGTYPIVYTISHRGTTTRMPAELSVKREHWDNVRRIVIVRPDKVRLNNILTQGRLNIERVIFELHQQGRLAGKTAADIKKMVAAESAHEDGDTQLFVNIYNQFVETKDNARTKEIYMRTWAWIEKYDSRAGQRHIEDIDLQWLMGFDKAMLNNKKNSRNIHFRNIRAVFNFAIDNEYTTAYPFRRFKIRPEATRKRSMSAEQMRMMLTTTEVLPRQVRYIDFFRLQFYLIGINIVDLFDNVALVNGRIEYTRAKTHRLYSIKAEPEAMAIIEQYRATDGDRLLRFAPGHHRNFTRRLDKALNEIAGVTSYWARHTWATIAASLDIPKDTIAAALGHGGNTVTDIYIDFDQKKVDEANRKVIDYVLYGKIER